MRGGAEPRWQPRTRPGSPRPPRLGAGPVAVDAHAAERLAAERMLPGPRADDVHLISGGDKGQSLLPDPPVERHGKILDQDQDVRALMARRSASKHRKLG